MSTAAINPLSAGSGDEGIIHLRVLTTPGIDLPKTAKILDFGCGAGDTFRALRSLGYINASGYDVIDGRARLGADREHIRVGTVLDLRLPYEDNTFDLVISDQVFEHVQDQVRVFEELRRITRPGGHGLAPLSGALPSDRRAYICSVRRVFQHRWLYKRWALLGIRNYYQTGLSADETADDNAYFAIEATRYVPTSCYRVLWKKVGFEYRFAEQEFFDGHVRSSMRA